MVLELTQKILTRFGFADYELMLSTRPDKAVGSDEIWDTATAALRGALERKGWAFGVDEGGGAFYGPKIDLKIKDALGRQWQCSTVQCDFNLPERFDLNYRDAEGGSSRPIMVPPPSGNVVYPRGVVFVMPPVSTKYPRCGRGGVESRAHTSQ